MGINKKGTNIAHEFLYRYSGRERINDNKNCVLFNEITQKSANLFVKGGDIISKNALVTGRHEVDTEELIKTFRNNGYNDFFLDIGANIGLTSCLAGNGFDKIFCYEPNPQIFRILQTNIELTFGIENKVSLYNFGLGKENSQLKLTIPKTNFGGAYIQHGNSYTNDILMKKDGITDPSNAYNYIDVSVENTKSHLDEIFQSYISLGSKGVIKIDVEGYETYIIEKLAETLPSNNSCAVIFENHDKNINPNAIKSYFSRNISLYRLKHYPVKSMFKDKFLRKIKTFFGATGHYTLNKLGEEKDHTGQLLIVAESTR